MKSEAPRNSAMAKMRKELAEAQRENAELRQWVAREERIRVAFAMAREGNFSDTHTRLLLEIARNPRPDFDVENAYKTILEIQAEEQGEEA